MWLDSLRIRKCWKISFLIFVFMFVGAVHSNAILAADQHGCGGPGRLSLLPHRHLYRQGQTQVREIINRWRSFSLVVIESTGGANFLSFFDV